MAHWEKMLRLSSYRLHQSLVQKPLNIEDYWPIRGDKKIEREHYVLSKEMYEEIKKAHNLN